MSFAAPERLWLLVLVAGLAAAYVALQVRRGRYAVRFTNLELLDTVAPERPAWRRHLPALGFLLMLVPLVVALARPEREEQVPREQATVVLALDVSLSMMADDVDPTRLEAAQEAAQRFIDELPDGLQLGLVGFSGTTSVIPPTRDHQEIRDAVARLQLAEGTAIGDAVLVGLDAIAAVPPDDGAEPVPAVMVVMSDGETTVGSPVDLAVTAAVDAGVPVSTIAFGTPQGSIVVPGQGTIDVPVREADLEELAGATGGRFFTAESLGELSAVYDDIGSAIGFETETRDISAWFTGLALVLAFVTGALSLAWFSRLP